MIRGLLCASLLLISCSLARAQDLTGAGGSFPNPVYSRWFAEYSRLHPNVRINYQPIGSGAGIRQVSQGIVDFGATDAPMTDAQLHASRRPLLHVPTLLGAVVPVYSLPGVPAPLNFSPDVLADIFLGRITRWDDPRLRRDNPRVALPAQGIVPVYRADGSGSTFVFTDFLSKTSAAFRQQVGSGISVRWPAGIGSKGNEGVAGLVRGTPYSLGYVELSYAHVGGLQAGRVRNREGRFIAAAPESVQAAAMASLASITPDFRVSITDPHGPESYPVSSFTWLLVPTPPQHPTAKELALDAFLRWLLETGAAEPATNGYAALPQALLVRVRGAVAGLP